MPIKDCKLIGRWRIVEADTWDREYLDLCGPATLTIRDDGWGEIAFGALQASLDFEYGRESIGFDVRGFRRGRREFAATARPSSWTTARSRSNSTFTRATRPFSRPRGPKPHLGNPGNLQFSPRWGQSLMPTRTEGERYEEGLISFCPAARRCSRKRLRLVDRGLRQRSAKGHDGHGHRREDPEGRLAGDDPEEADYVQFRRSRSEQPGAAVTG